MSPRLRRLRRSSRSPRYQMVDAVLWRGLGWAVYEESGMVTSAAAAQASSARSGSLAGLHEEIEEAIEGLRSALMVVSIS